MRKKNNSHGRNSLSNRQAKDNRTAANKKVFAALNTPIPKTMRMVEDETGVRVSSQCQYLEDLQNIGLAVMLGKKHCLVSGWRAGFYSTNPQIIAEWKQRR